MNITWYGLIVWFGHPTIHSMRACVPTSTYLSLIISSFVTADVTPPRLVFLTSQRFSNENFTINWRFNEEATATCTLQTPTDQSTEICNNGVFMRTRLKGGLHFLFVQGTDLAGNTGRPMRYDWIVGEYNNTNKLVCIAHFLGLPAVIYTIIWLCFALASYILHVLCL